MSWRSAGALGILFASAMAAANPNTFESSGFGTRAVGTAEAFGPTITDPSALYYNPAGIASGQSSIQVLANTYVSGVSTRVQSQDQTRPLDCSACQPGTTMGFSFGALFPLHGKLEKRVTIGVGADLPVAPLARMHVQDPSQPTWFLQSNRERISLLMGLGIRPWPFLSFGVGTQVTARLEGRGFAGRIDPFSRTILFREIDTSLKALFSPTAGVRAEVGSHVSLGLSYRAPASLSFEFPAAVKLQGLTDLTLVVGGMSAYTPHTFEWGGTWTPVPAWSFSAAVQWALWSLTPDSFVQKDVDFSGEVLDGLGLGNALDLASTPLRLGFHNTVSVRLGAQWSMAPVWVIRGGVAYQPTPIPRQTGVTNLLDSSSFVLAAGAGVRLAFFETWIGVPMELSAAAQLRLYTSRTAPKESWDSVPSYAYSAVGGTGVLQLATTF